MSGTESTVNFLAFRKRYSCHWQTGKGCHQEGWWSCGHGSWETVQDCDHRSVLQTFTETFSLEPSPFIFKQKLFLCYLTRYWNVPPNSGQGWGWWSDGDLVEGYQEGWHPERSCHRQTWNRFYAQSLFSSGILKALKAMFIDWRVMGNHFITFLKTCIHLDCEHFECNVWSFEILNEICKDLLLDLMIASISLDV